MGGGWGGVKHSDLCTHTLALMTWGCGPLPPLTSFRRPVQLTPRLRATWTQGLELSEQPCDGTHFGWHGLLRVRERGREREKEKNSVVCCRASAAWPHVIGTSIKYARAKLSVVSLARGMNEIYRTSARVRLQCIVEVETHNLCRFKVSFVTFSSTYILN